MKTAGALSDRSKAELAQMAKNRGVRGWATMDKGELLKALAKITLPHSGPSVVKASKTAAKTTIKATKKATTTVVAKVPKAEPVANRTTAAARPPAKPVPPTIVKVPAKPESMNPPAPKIPAQPQPARVAPTANGLHKNPVAAVPPKPVTKPLVPKPAPAAKPSLAKTFGPARDGSKDSPATRNMGPLTKDRILLAVSNPYWLNAYWEISSHSIQRAEAALKQDWHGARLIIRLFDVTSQDTTSTSETPVKDIIIQGPGQNWYIDVPQPPRMYRADIGYVSRRGEFYVLARSNVVTPPKAGAGENIDADEATWDDQDAKWKAERILAMSTGFESTGSAELREFLEERTGKTLGPPKETAFGTGALPPGSVKKFFFEIDAKLIVFGRTDPSAHLTLNNDPIKLNPDGTFRMTFNLPDSRQIIPAVAASADGVEERTIVLAVERNTKHLDPMIHDQMNEV
jgi:hypothetical protein